MLSREKLGFSLYFVFIEMVLVSVFSVLNYETLTVLDLTIWRTVLIMPLIWNIIYALWKGASPYKVMLLIAFVLIWVADLLLIRIFMAGLIVFLLAHLLLGINYNILYKDTHKREWLYALAILIPMTAFYIFLFPHISDSFLKYGFIGYMLVISYSVWRGLLLWGKFNRVFAVAVFVGEILFLLCDCEVAYVVVLGKTPLLQIINNILYYGGLTLLSLSAVFFEERKGEV